MAGRDHARNTRSGAQVEKCFTRLRRQHVEQVIGVYGDCRVDDVGEFCDYDTGRRRPAIGHDIKRPGRIHGHRRVTAIRRDPDQQAHLPYGFQHRSWDDGFDRPPSQRFPSQK